METPKFSIHLTEADFRYEAMRKLLIMQSQQYAMRDFIIEIAAQMSHREADRLLSEFDDATQRYHVDLLADLYAKHSALGDESAPTPPSQ